MKRIIIWKWISYAMIFLACIYMVEAVRQTFYCHRKYFAIASKTDKELKWDEIYGNIRSILKLEEDEDFYFTIADLDENADHGKLRGELTQGIEIKNKKLNFNFDVIVQRKEDSFYRYELVYSRDKLKVERYIPKLYGGYRYKAIKCDEELVYDKCAKGRDVFDIFKTAFPVVKMKDGSLENRKDASISIFNQAVEVDNEDAKMVWVTDNSDSKETQGSSLEEGWYVGLHVKLKTNDVDETYLKKIN